MRLHIECGVPPFFRVSARWAARHVNETRTENQSEVVRYNIDPQVEIRDFEVEEQLSEVDRSSSRGNVKSLVEFWEKVIF